MVMLLYAGLASCSKPTEETDKIPITSISIDVAPFSISMYDTYIFRAEWFPENATYRDLTWKSSDEGVALINWEGQLTAVKPGITEITASVDGVISNTCIVTVEDKRYLDALVTIPDTKFKYYLVNKLYVRLCPDEPDPFRLIDVNRDGEMSEREALLATDIDCRDYGINSIKGIEYFMNLTKLTLYDNKLKLFDISKNAELTELYSSSCDLVALDITKNTELAILQCFHNQLMNLDVSNNRKLKRLECSNNRIRTLDVSNCTALEYLDCGTNQLITLNVSNNPKVKALYCATNQLTTLDVSKSIALEYLSCNHNRLKVLDVSKNKDLKNLDCQNNELTTLDVSENTVLEVLNCYNNPNLTTVFVKKGQNIKISKESSTTIIEK